MKPYQNLRIYLEPLDYCHKFNLISSEYDFNRVEFLNTLFSEFLDYYLNDQVDLDSNGFPTYKRWVQIVNNYYQKFHSISRTMSSLRADNMGLSKNLWGYFYAQYIIPERDSRYPEKAAYIYAKKRKQLQEEQDKINNRENRQLYPRPSR